MKQIVINNKIVEPFLVENEKEEMYNTSKRKKNLNPIFLKDKT